MSLLESRDDYGHINIYLDFIAICHGGKQSAHCKGILLSLLEDHIIANRNVGNNDYILLSLTEWTALMLGIYARQIIARSLTELVEDNLVLRRPVIVSGTEHYEYTLNFEKVNELIQNVPAKFYKSYTPQSEPPELSVTYYGKNNAKSTLSEDWVSGGDQTEKIHRNNVRARKLGLPATLTLSQWMRTIRYYNWQCAICQERPYQILEHFIPLALRLSGTTADNCIPACIQCNRLKSNIHPSSLPESLVLQDRIKEIKLYLATRSLLEDNVEVDGE